MNQQDIEVLIANKIIPKSANLKQIEYFFKVCERKKLDPFLKQIHMIERKEKSGETWISSFTIQSSLDGMRAIAQRNVKIKSYRRWTEYNEGFDGKKQIYGCCEIETFDRGLYSDKVPFGEYAQKTREGKTTHFWAQFPETMIKKVAEESVLRMVAPEDLSDVYGDDEMDQASNEPKQLKEPENKITLDTSVAQLANRNYTEEAQQCQTIEELKAWYAGLNLEEKKNLTALKNNRKKEIEESLKSVPTSPDVTNGHQGEDASEAITKLIKALNEKSWGPELAEIENLLDQMSIDLRNEYKVLYFDRLNKLGLKTDYQPLPF